MAFQFMCPQGHLLQAEESQAGQVCACPFCAVEFVIPMPVVPPAESPPAPPSFSQGFGAAAGQAAPAAFSGSDGTGASGFAPASGFAASPAEQAAEQPPVFTPAATSGPAPLVHVPCPSGHVLETPREMLGQDAMCPYCQAVFHLRWEDSLEYRKAKEEEELRREQRLGRLWMQWSIAVAVVVVFGLILLIALTRSNQ